MTQDLRRLANVQDDELTLQEPPFNRTAVQDDFLAQQGVRRRITDRPMYELAQYSPTTLNPRDEELARVPTTPLEQEVGYSLRGRPPENDSSILSGTFSLLKGVGASLLESVNVTEKGLSARERMWRGVNIVSLALPFGLGSRAVGAAASRLFPAAGAALSTAKGRILLTGVSEAAIAGGIETIRDPEEGNRNVTAAVVLGGALGVGGQTIIQRVARSARLKASKEAIAEFQDATRLGQDNSPLLTREWAILTPQQADVAQRAQLEGAASPSAVLARDQITQFRKTLEEEGFLTQTAKLSDGRDAILLPGVPRADAVRIGRELGMSKIHTRDGMIDLELDVMFPTMKTPALSGQIDSQVDDWFELTVDPKTKAGPTRAADQSDMEWASSPLSQDNSVRLSPIYNMAEPVTYGRHSKPVDLGDMVLDRSVYDISNFERFAALDTRDVLNTLYARVVNATHGGSLFDEVLNIGKAPRAAGGMKGAREIVRGGVITDGIQKTMQINAAKSMGYTEVGIKTGIRNWDNVQEMADGFNKPLFDILKPIPANEMEGFIKYGFLRQWQEYARKGFEVPPNLKDTIDARVLEVGAPTHWDKALDEVTQHQNTFLRETLVKTGLVSREQMERYIAQNPMHMPLTRRPRRPPRNVEELDTYLHEVEDPTRRARGTTVSDKDRWVPWPEEIIRRQAMYARMAGQQEVYNKLGGVLREMPEALKHFAVPVNIPGGALNKASEISPGINVGLSKLSNEDGIFFKSLDEEGVEQWFRLADTENGKLLADALEFMGPSQAGGIVRAFGQFASLQRAGITLGADFIGKSVGRDIVFAFANAGIHPTAFARGALTMLQSKVGGEKAAALLDEFVASGGARAALVSQDRNYFAKLIRQSQRGGDAVQTTKNVLSSLNPLEALRALSEGAENATRVGAFRQRKNQLLRAAKDEGVDLDPKVLMQEAALMGRTGSVDFQMHGSSKVMANMRVMTAFLGAAVQGTDQIVRAIKTDPVGVGSRMLLGITAPSVGLYLHNRKDPEYTQLPPYERDLFWHIKIKRDASTPEDDKWLRIPKPFEAGIMAGSFVERFLQFLDEKDPAILDEAASSMSATLAAGYSPIPTALQPLLENLSNASSVSGQPIIPEALKDVDPSFHDGSEFAKGLARMLNSDVENATEKISPRQLDNMIRGWTGGLGTMVNDMSDLTVAAYRRHKGETMVPSPERDWMDIMPVVRGYVSPFPSGASSVRDAYDYAEQMRVAQRTLSYLESSLRTDDMVDYATNNGMMVGLNRITSKMTTDFARLREARGQVLMAPNMTPQEKRRSMREIDNAMLTYSTAVNKAMRELGLRANDATNPAAQTLRGLMGNQTQR